MLATLRYRLKDLTYNATTQPYQAGDIALPAGSLLLPSSARVKRLTYAAQAAWTVFDKANQIKQNPSFTPKWSDKPLLKSYQKTKPPLGWPRETDSLCPRCVPEIRQQILDGKTPLEVLLNEKVGEIKAQIIERDGKILMVKDCPIHGHFEDVMAIDTAFFKHLEECLPGPRYPRPQRRASAQSRLQHHHPRPRLGADHRSDQPLQHDVRSRASWTPTRSGSCTS